MTVFKKLMKLVLVVGLVFLAVAGCQFYRDSEEKYTRCTAAEFTPGPMPSYQDAAVKVNEGMQTCFGNDLGTSWYTKYVPSFLQALAWPLGQALAGSLALANSPHPPPGLDAQIKKEFETLEHYWDADSTPPGYNSTVHTIYSDGEKYYDDNHWIALVLLTQHERTHDSWYLQRAQAVFKLLEFAAQNTEHLAHPGGVMWTERPGKDFRAAVSTAGAAQVALQLHRLTGQEHYLQFAESMHRWMQSTLRSEEGLYWDGINGDGAIEKTYFSYNQGLMVGNGVLLYRATGERQYLKEAEVLADQSLRYYQSKNELERHFPAFNAIFFENLLKLESVNHNPHYRKVMEQYAAHLWKTVHPEHGVFFHEGRRKSILNQAAVVQVFSYLATPAPAARETSHSA